MDQWKKTSCVLCLQNCGLEVNVVNNRITKVRGDKENPRSQGYVCRKGVEYQAVNELCRELSRRKWCMHFDLGVMMNRHSTMAKNPIDARKPGLIDKEIARVVTEAGSEELEVEVTEDARAGQVLVPHGFGLKYKGEVHGINVNRLCRNTHRDRIAATPLHRFVPCRVEKVGN